MENTNKVINVYEFADHYRQLIHFSGLLEKLNIKYNARRSKNSKLHANCKIIYLNPIKQYMKLAFDKSKTIIIHSAPEFYSKLEKIIFILILKSKSKHCNIKIIVRDFKNDRCGYIIKSLNNYSNITFLCESEFLSKELEKKFNINNVDFIYPSPIFSKSPKSNNMLKNKLVVGVTGSFNLTRRNYNAIVNISRYQNIDFLLLGNAEKITAEFQNVFKFYKNSYLNDKELDKYFHAADVLLDLNNSKFYGSNKGSGSLGDAFYFGKKIISQNKNIPKDLLIYCEINELHLMKVFIYLQQNKNKSIVHKQYQLRMLDYFKDVLLK